MVTQRTCLSVQGKKKITQITCLQQITWNAATDEGRQYRKPCGTF